MSYVSQSITIVPTCVEVSDFYWHAFIHLFIFMEKLTLSVHLRLITLYVASLQCYWFLYSDWSVFALEHFVG
jgi:hypothetical protein